jgi:hypothetical protein
MHKDKKWDDHDQDALEYQIEKMIDELFVTMEGSSDSPEVKGEQSPQPLEFDKKADATPGLSQEKPSAALDLENGAEQAVPDRDPAASGLTAHKTALVSVAANGPGGGDPQGSAARALRGGETLSVEAAANGDPAAPASQGQLDTCSPARGSGGNGECRTEPLSARHGSLAQGGQHAEATPLAADLPSAGAGSADANPRRGGNGSPNEGSAEDLCRALKEHMLSLDWEISPQNINSYLELMQALKARLADDAMAVKTTMMMSSVLNYLKKTGRSAVPVSMQVLQTGVDFLGLLLVPAQAPSTGQRRDVYARLVDQYRALKLQIDPQRERAPQELQGLQRQESSIPSDLSAFIHTTVRQSVAALVEETVQRELSRIRHEVLSLLETVRPHEPDGEAERKPLTESREEVLTATLGGEVFLVAKTHVARVYPISERTQKRIAASGSFRLKDLVPLFSSPSKGLQGPLAHADPRTLKERELELVDVAALLGASSAAKCGQLVLVSDGDHAVGFLAESTAWRSTRTALAAIASHREPQDTTRHFLRLPDEPHPVLNVAKLLRRERGE